HDDGLPLLEGVIEDVRQASVPPFRHPRGVSDRLFFLRIVVHVEVLRLENSEVEGAILHLVAAKVLASRGLRERKCEHQGERDGGEPSNAPQGVFHAASFTVWTAGTTTTAVP